MTAYAMQTLKSIACFFLAGLCELSGTYLIWQWWRNGKTPWLIAAAIFLLVGYAIVNTFQAVSFGRSFAAYGGVFIAMALMWGWLIDHTPPDKFDVIGACICLVGVAIIMYTPR